MRSTLLSATTSAAPDTPGAGAGTGTGTGTGTRTGTVCVGHLIQQKLIQTLRRLLGYELDRKSYNYPTDVSEIYF